MAAATIMSAIVYVLALSIFKEKIKESLTIPICYCYYNAAFTTAACVMCNIFNGTLLSNPQDLDGSQGS